MTRLLPDASSPSYLVELDFDLLVSQRNELFTLAASAGFARNELEWLATDGSFFGIEGRMVPMIRHSKSGFYCAFGYRDEQDYRRSRHGSQPNFGGEFFIQRAPGAIKARDDLAWVSWQEIAAAFAEWLSFIRRETLEPDYWVVSPPTGLLAAASSAENRPFTEAERQRIARDFSDSLDEIRQTARLSDAQFRSLKSTVDDISEAATRLGRKDWMNALLGAYVGWAMTNTLGSQLAQSVFDLMAHKLVWLWTEIPKFLGR